MQQATQTSQPEPFIFDSLDRAVDEAVQSYKRMKTGDLADTLTATFQQTGYATARHNSGEKTAVIGVMQGQHSKVQVVVTKDNAIYARYNGRDYSLQDPVEWDPLVSQPLRYNFYHLSGPFC